MNNLLPLLKNALKLLFIIQLFALASCEDDGLKDGICEQRIMTPDGIYINV